MKYLAAFALCQLSGKTPTKSDVEGVLKAAGTKVDNNRLEELFANLKDKTWDKLVLDGSAKLSCGGSVAVAAPPSNNAAPKAAAKGGKEAAAPPPPAAKKEPEPEEEDDIGLGGLF